MQLAELDVEGWHRVVRVSDQSSGLNAVISVHDISVGPGCGGCRIFPYADFESGLADANRLSQGMTYKNALAGIPFGGGKAVIYADTRKNKTPEMLLAFGKAVHALDGLYYTAEDSGMTEDDIIAVSSQTPFAAGTAKAGQGGNPAPYTARGVWRGIHAAARHKFGSDDLRGRKITIVGVGAVGMELARLLHEDGAELTVADVHQPYLDEAASRFGAKIVAPEAAAGISCDIFSPCALGQAINETTINQLDTAIVAGAANNQLARPEYDQELLDRGILYAPDYVINAAGVISVGLEILKTWSIDEMNTRIDAIRTTLGTVFENASTNNAPTGQVANSMAEAIIKRGTFTA